jgi:hypothetical protein
MKICFVLILMVGSLFAEDRKWDKMEISWNADSDYVGGPAEQAFAIWNASSGGKFTFTKIDGPADINFIDKKGGVSLTNAAYLAETYVYPSASAIEHVDIVVYMDNPNFILEILLHEEGHALGLGHSTDIQAVMYPVVQGYTVLHKSDADALGHLYGFVPVAPDIGLLITRIRGKFYQFSSSYYLDLTMKNRKMIEIGFLEKRSIVNFKFRGAYPFFTTWVYRGWSQTVPIQRPSRKS